MPFRSRVATAEKRGLNAHSKGGDRVGHRLTQRERFSPLLKALLRRLRLVSQQCGICEVGVTPAARSETIS